MKDLPFTALLKPTLESTLEVVAIAFGGWLLSKKGILNRSVQKSLSGVNLNLFTPCLIFSKLASSLNLSVLADLWTMPLLFAIVCGVSWVVAVASARCCGVGKRWEKFVISCSMFQNSNSLPIAIVSSLAYTLHRDLYWDKISKDTAEQVVSRGILYLLIFAQLGLMVRWSYGYRYLLAPEDDFKSDEESQTDSSDTPRLVRHPTMDADENTPLIYHQQQHLLHHNQHQQPHHNHAPLPHNNNLLNNNSHSRTTSHSDFPASDYEYSTAGTSPLASSTPHFLSSHSHSHSDDEEEIEDIIFFPPPHVHRPRPLFKRLRRFTIIVWREFLDFMNMPLWAMLVAVAVALFPRLQHYLFFEKDGFVRGSVIYAIKTLGDVSIPLILVILGANIANEERPYSEEEGEVAEVGESETTVVERKWVLTQRQRALILGVASRMIIVPLIICPLTIPVMLWGVRYHMGVLCDPIFWVVCWLLIGSPTAVQLTQITQLNCVFEGEMATVLWWDYVVFCAPMTMALVIGSLEVLGWAQRAALNT